VIAYVTGGTANLWAVVVRASRPQDGFAVSVPVRPSISPGLLGRPWRPSVARAAWSFSGNGEGATTLPVRRRPPSELVQPVFSGVPVECPV